MPSHFRRGPKLGGSLGKVPEKTHKTALVIIPPNECQQAIQNIRKKHDRQIRRWMPHINLLYPFKPKSEFFKVLDLLSIVCDSVNPFEISLSTFRYFRHDKNRFTIWLGVEPNEKVKQLQQKLWKMVPECHDLNTYRTGFTPHLSVGQSTGKERTKELIDGLQNSWKPIRFQLKAVHLIWRRDPPNDQFHVSEKVFLKRAKVV